MSQTRCNSTGCAKWSFQAGQCKDHYKPPPAPPALAKHGSGESATGKPAAKDEVDRPYRSVSDITKAMNTSEKEEAALRSSQEDVHGHRHSAASRTLGTKQSRSKAFSVLHEDKTIKSQIDEDIAARVKKLNITKKQLTAGEAPPVVKSKGIFGGLFTHEPSKVHAPSKDEIKRQKGLRGTSAAAIAEMNQKGITKLNTDSLSTSVPPSSPAARASSNTTFVPPSSPLASSLLSPSSSNNNRASAASVAECKGGLFGVDLVAVCEGGELPLPIQMILTKLQEEHAEAQGLFRISGSADDISQLISTINSCWHTPGSQRDSLLDGYEVHTLSGVLKQFWRKLPEPLFPYSMYPKLIQCAEGKDAEGIIGLYNQLPPPRLRAATSLFLFLAEISKHEEVNMMSAMNLSVCFAPNLIRPQQDTMDTIIHDTPKVIACVCVIIEFFLESSS